MDCIISDEKDVFLKTKGACINYSTEKTGKGLWVYPDPLLLETGISRQIIVRGNWEDLPCFFLQKEGDIPFDIFAASFYLITRYEEYTDSETDAHGRFIAENSLAYREKFLQIPLVDRWSQILKKMISNREEDTESTPRNFRLISTFDIDHPFLYRNKGCIKNFAGGVGDLLRGRYDLVKKRLLTQLHLQPDPYQEIITRIDRLHHEHNKDYFLFILTGKYGKYDRRTIYPLRKYYRYLRSLYDVRFGLHPSYRASFDLERIRKEKENLEKKLESAVKRNRQHYLRMRFPETYDTLNKLDFTEDFTLIYPSQPGFRASTAIPFHFFNLQSDEHTELLIRPTVIMDTTFFAYLRLSPEESLLQIKELMKECHLSGGDFTMLWHNSTLADPEQNPWYKIFIECFLYGISLEKAYL